jgi:hypothetical protein
MLLNNKKDAAAMETKFLKRTEKQAWGFEKVCSLKLHFIHPQIKQSVIALNLAI